MFNETLMKKLKDPYNPDYNYHLGKEYENMNQYSSALTYFLRSVDFSSNSDLTYNATVSAARCLIELGDRFGTAKRLLKEALQLNENGIDATYFLCLIYKYLGMKEDYTNLYPKLEKLKNKDLSNRLYEDFIDLETVEKLNIEKRDTIYSSEDQSTKDFKYENINMYSNIVSKDEQKKKQLDDLYNAVKECQTINDISGSYEFLVTILRLNSLIRLDIKNSNTLEYVKHVSSAIGKGKSIDFIDENETYNSDAFIFSAGSGDIYEVLSSIKDNINKCIIVSTTKITDFKDLYSLIIDIEKFAVEHKQWKLRKVTKNNSDLIIIEKD